MLQLVATLVTCATLTAVDGDTIKCDGQNMRLLGNGAPNVEGVDTPEVSKARCHAERVLADKATARLSELLETPGIRIETSGVSDFYSRPLVRVRMPDGRTAGQIMISEGLARKWLPGRHNDWCR